MKRGGEKKQKKEKRHKINKRCEGDGKEQQKIKEKKNKIQEEEVEINGLIALKIHLNGAVLR